MGETITMREGQQTSGSKKRARDARDARGDRATRTGRLDLDALLLAGVFVLGLLPFWWAAQPAFVLPNNDYYSFERAAQSLAAFELPESLKRGPTFPALMALAAPLVGGEHPYLRGALLVNALLTLSLLALLFGFARHLVGRGALLVCLLLVVSSEFESMALQPLVEPTLGCLVLLTFWLFQRGSPWQYAAGALVALTRTDTALIVPALALANALEDGRWKRHAGFTAAAALPALVWLLLGSGRGEETNFYLELMLDTGFSIAPGFIATSLKQPFEGWFRGWDDQLPTFLVMVGLPLALGVREGFRKWRQEALGLSLFYLGGVVAVVGYGIDKGRYVYPTVWIPLLFFAAGLLVILRALRRWIDARPNALTRVFAAGATTLVGAGLLWRYGNIWLAKYAKTTEGMRQVGGQFIFDDRLGRMVPGSSLGQGDMLSMSATGPLGMIPADFWIFTVLLLALLVGGWRWAANHDGIGSGGGDRDGERDAGSAPDGAEDGIGSSPTLSGRLAALSILAAVVVPLFLGGITLYRYEHDKVRYKNFETWLLARWLQENMGPMDRAVALHPSHLEHVTGMERERFAAFSSFDAPAEDFVAFVAELRAEGFTYVAYTHRDPPKDPATDRYYRSNKMALAERLQAGAPLEGLEHVATLEAPERLERHPTQIYRVLP